MDKNIESINSRRCLIALIVSILIVSISFVGVTKKLLMPLTEGSAIAGKDVFRYFTVISTVAINVCAVLCIPFEIQGIIKHNYHLPRWIVDFLYISTTCTTMTFMVSSVVIAPNAGIKATFFEGSLLYMHFLCPILALLLFLAVNLDHNIKKSRLALSIVPMSIYIIVYYYEVFILTESNGGWVDHYFIGGNISIGLLFIIVVITNLIVSYILLKVHNISHSKYKKAFINYYMNSPKYEFSDVSEAIIYLAKEDKKYYKEGDITIPIRIIKILKNRYSSNFNDNELYTIYINSFNSK